MLREIPPPQAAEDRSLWVGMTEYTEYTDNFLHKIWPRGFDLGNASNLFLSERVRMTYNDALWGQKLNYVQTAEIHIGHFILCDGADIRA